MGTQVFEGLKVTDFSWAAVGPVMARYLANHGATVVRVESTTHPDVLRTSPPFKEGTTGLDRSADFSNLNSNKLSLSLNMNHPQGREVAKKLIRWADVVIENFSPGVMKRWGLSYEEIRELKPDIIMMSSSALGQYGPHHSHPGHGGALVSLSGFTHVTGRSDGEPNQPFGAYTDFITPRFGAAALVAALDYRRRTGQGQHLDLSQFEAGLQFMAPHLLDYFANERESQRMGNHSPDAAPHNAYRCAGDDRWCVIAVETEEEWQRFCQVLGNPAWCQNPRFATTERRKAHEDELDQLIEQWTADRSAEEVMEAMQGVGVAAGVVKNAADICTDPQLNHRRFFQQLDHPGVGPHLFHAPAFVMSESPPELKRSPCIGEHNELVCREILGLSEEEFVQLVVDGVLQ